MHFTKLHNLNFSIYSYILNSRCGCRNLVAICCGAQLNQSTVDANIVLRIPQLINVSEVKAIQSHTIEQWSQRFVHLSMISGHTSILDICSNSTPERYSPGAMINDFN